MFMIMNRFHIILALLIINFLFFSAAGFAQSQTAMNVKAYSDYKKADSELNTVYQKILRSYGKETTFIKKLRNAQRLWIQLRDAELGAKYPDSGNYGSVAPMCESIYLKTLTKERIKFLSVWLTGIQEGEVCLGSVRQKS